jgi:hypothetical protein
MVKNHHNIPEFVVIGYITEDVTTGIGGIAYSALTAYRLGFDVGVVSTVSRQLDLRELQSIQLNLTLSDTSTKFENIYRLGERFQRIIEVAPKIKREHIPPSWFHVPIVHIAPIAQEVSVEVCDEFEGLVGVSAQGWLGTWDNYGIVKPKSGVNLKVDADVLIVSEHDIIKGMPRFDGILIITRGSAGADIYAEGISYHFPAFETVIADPTGAGDAFATAFLVSYHKTGDIIESGIFATCTASFVIEDIGVRSMVSYSSTRYETAYARTFIGSRYQAKRDVRLFIIMLVAIFNQIFIGLIILAGITHLEVIRRLLTHRT